MKKPRTMHIAASAGYLALALTAAGMVLLPPDMTPSIDLDVLRLGTVAQQTDGASPEPRAPRASHGVTRGAVTPTPADGSSSVAAPPPMTLGCPVDADACDEADGLAPAILALLRGVAVAQSGAVPSAPEVGLPTDGETGATPDPSPAADPGTGTTDPSADPQPDPADPTPTSPVPSPTPSGEPTQPGDPGGEPSAEPTPTPTPEPTGAPVPTSEPTPNSTSGEPLGPGIVDQAPAGE